MYSKYLLLLLLLISYTSCQSTPSEFIVPNNCSHTYLNLMCIRCDQGFYSDSSYLCTQCSTNISNCQKCDSYFGGAVSCIKCQSGYRLNGSNQCVSCEHHPHFCVCQDNQYFNSETSECQACNVKFLGCATCDGESCQVCQNGYYEDIYYSPTSEFIGTTCVPCGNIHAGCSSCMKRQFCVGCDEQAGFLPFIKFDTSIGCECKPGFSLNEETGTCEECVCGVTIPHCLGCSNANVCQNCEKGYIWHQGACKICSDVYPNGETCIANASSISLLSCAFGFTVDADGKNCVRCYELISGCIICQQQFSTDLACYYCSAFQHFEINPLTKHCDCQAGYHLTINETCCRQGCRHCTNTTCLQCHESLNMIPEQGTDRCVCRKGYFWNGDQCVNCHDDIFGCSDCSGLSGEICSECDATLNLEINEETGSCQCVDGYFESLGFGDETFSFASILPETSFDCVSCGSFIPHCKYCLPGGLECTDCQVGFILDETHGHCVDCATFVPGCTACDASAECTDCDEDNNYFLNETTKKCQCNDGFTFDEEDRECSACDEDIPHCVNCTTNTLCNKCSYHYGINSQGGCTSCETLVPGCDTCDIDSECTGCNGEWNFVVEPEEGGCVCIANHYYNSTTRHCETCSSALDNCVTCESNQVCTDCLSGYGVSADNKCRVCSELIPGCTACEDYTECSACNTDQGFLWNEATKSCDCVVGTSLNVSTSLCSDCNNLLTNCIRCGSTECTQCSSAYLLVNQQCAACSSQVIGCTECLGGSSCGTCDQTQNFRLEGDQCVCVSGYALNAATRQCQPCHVTLTKCLTCTNTTFCTSCQSDTAPTLVGITQVCRPCSNSLVGCTNCASTTQCSTCNEQGNFEKVNNECVCKRGYSLEGNVCQSCNTTLLNCLACSNTEECDECEVGYIQNWDGVYPGCEPCQIRNYGCLSCNQAVGCLECDASKHFVPNGKYCKCEPGFSLYFLDCQECNLTLPNCATCTSYTNCTTCESGYALVTETRTCAPCSNVLPGCVTCQSTTTCSTCNTDGNFEKVNNQCVCKSGFALNPSTNECQPCSQTLSNCLTCNNVEFCNACETGYALLAAGNAQSCQLCEVTLPGCTTCSSGSVCTTCNASQNFEPSGNNCVCKSGFAYNSATRQCQACSVTLTNCLTCTNTSFCNSCGTGYALLAATDAQSCQLCEVTLPGCTTCNSGSQCTTCNTAQNFEPSGNNCICKSGFAYNPTTRQCQTCVQTLSNCLTCTNTSFCNSCGTGFALLAGSDSQSCQTCEATLPGCTICSSGTQCTTCNTQQNFQPSGNNCVCKSGFAYNSATRQCQTCSVTLTNCLTCANTSFCNSCGTGYALLAAIDAQSCQLCEVTLPGCTACSSGFVCTTCNASQNFEPSGNNCVCKSGFAYNSTSRQCQPCSQSLSNCLTCTNTSYCNSCGTGYALASSGPNNRTCQLCQVTLAGCTTCTSTTTCTGCNTTQNYQLSGSTCGCASGYFLNSSSQCQACTSWSAQCTTCTPSGCSACSANYVVNGTGCRQSCNVTGCTTCLNSTACSQCGPNFSLSSNKRNCTCNSGYVLVNGACQSCSTTMPGCESCSSTTSCSGCGDSFYLSGSKCNACGFGCKTCNSLLCYGCISPAYVNTWINDCYCSNSAYKNTTTNTCELCSSTMSSCTECNNSTYCTSCTDGYYALNGECKCYSNQYYNTNWGACQSCPNNCLECSAPNVCTKCDNNKRRELKNGYCACKTGYVSFYSYLGYNDGYTCY